MLQCVKVLNKLDIVLASTSPRRKELLEKMVSDTIRKRLPLRLPEKPLRPLERACLH